MTKGKKLGIWMDHASAHVMEYSTDAIHTNIVYAKTGPEHEAGTPKNENVMNNKEQQTQADYYKQLGEIIKKYDEVVLFGPTEAKVELFNNLRTHHFAKIKIAIKSTDKMTENQQHAFVKEHFSNG